MTAVWVTVGALAFATAALKLVGPLALGGRPLPPRAMSVVELLAASLLAALVVVETFGQGRSLVLDERVPGVAFAAIALRLRAPVVVVVLGTAAVAALWRLVSRRMAHAFQAKPPPGGGARRT
ncbi:MAG TPA: AzlD domain-containing protein [Solirubrobacteraceae bacterium]|nr:AzlD domain-containing protein [Solirubrobacteraceae bacterium]